MQEYYYKATLENGQSLRDQNFVYHIGLNICPAPDVKSKDSCGAGLHLAKSIKALNKSVKGYKEVYLAEPGVILGEDDQKVRCSYVWIKKKLNETALKKMEFAEKTEMERQIKLDRIMGGVTNPICGNDWIKDHAFDFTQEDFEALTMEVKSERRIVTLTNKLSKKELRTVLSSVR